MCSGKVKLATTQIVAVVHVEVNTGNDTFYLVTRFDYSLFKVYFKITASIWRKIGSLAIQFFRPPSCQHWR